MKNTIIFDMDGVVVDSEYAWNKSTTDFMESRGFTYDRKEWVAKTAGKGLHDSTKVFQQYFDLEEDIATLVEERFTRVRNLYHQVPYIKGFEAFYARVKERNIKTAIATACETVLLDIVSEHLKLPQLFGEHIYKIADVGYASKPAPDIFLYAAAKLGSQPHECVVIEDSPLGVTAAKSAGMRCVALSWTCGRPAVSHADIVVDSFEEISLDTLLA